MKILATIIVAAIAFVGAQAETLPLRNLQVRPPKAGQMRG